MFSKLGLQIYTVRDYMQDDKAIEETFEKLAAIGYTEGQTAGKESAEYARLAKKYGIDIVGTHIGYDKIVNEVDETIKLHEALGTTNIGIGAMPGEARKNYDGLMRFIEGYNNAAKIYAKHGFKLTYHNHSFEFVRIKDDKTAMDLMVENFDKDNISFVLDTCWVSNAGADVRHWLEKLAGRVDILHLKDIKPIYVDDSFWTQSRLCEIGEGSIWWDGVLETAERTGVKHYVVEQDNYWIDNDPFKSLEVSKKYLEKYMK